MVDIEVIRLSVDVVLAMALLYCGWTFFRSSDSAMMRRMRSLESGMVGLIQESELAGQTLNEKLLKRQGKIEDLLLDLDSLESKLLRAKQGAEEVYNELQLTVSRSRGRETREVHEVHQEERREAPSLTTQQGRASSILQNSSSQQNQTPPSSPDPVDLDRVNIFGEPIPDEPPLRKPLPQGKYKPLTQKIEKEVVTPQAEQDLSAEQNLRSSQPRGVSLYQKQSASAPKPREGTPKSKETQPHSQRPPEIKPAKEPGELPDIGPSGMSALQKVYDRAEELLRTGQSPDSVSAQTSIPIEELNLLSQMIELEREEALMHQKKADPRLGALGGMTRQTEIL